jgi:hypothetical protein
MKKIRRNLPEPDIKFQPDAQRVKNYLDDLKHKTELWIAQQDHVPLFQPVKMPKTSDNSGVPEGRPLQAGSGGTFFYNLQDKIAARHAANIKRITLEYVASKAERDAPAADKTWNDFAASAMEAKIASEISDLEFLISSGNRDAIAALARLARATTSKLSSLTPANIDQLKGLACRRVNWPVLRGGSPLHGDDDAQFKQLAVGTCAPFGCEMLPGLKKKAHKAAMRIAIELLCRLDDWRTREDGAIYWGRPLFGTEAEMKARQLEAFSRETWPDWFPLAWDILLEEHGGHPERNPELRSLGEYRKKHSVQEGAQKNLTPATAESNIKDGIRDRLRRAFEQLAR